MDENEMQKVNAAITAREERITELTTLLNAEAAAGKKNECVHEDENRYKETKKEAAIINIGWAVMVITTLGLLFVVLNVAAWVTLGILIGSLTSIFIILKMSSWIRATIYRNAFRKNVGLAFIIGDGNSIGCIKIDYGKATFKSNGKRYLLDPSRVKVWLGLPVLFYHHNNPLPLDMTPMITPAWNPDLVETFLLEQEALAFAKAINATKKLLQMIAIGVVLTILIGIVSIAIGFTSSQAIGTIPAQTAGIIQNLTSVVVK